ncbi:hypothetical protein [Flavobacterium ginsengisoli]|uniref:hypothetical protein n=1 Tax=Flavobacterium ginsengisoli TaxID=871694 RepID=UPI0024153641|nr:hypothetical protein [Flavobacterium ginsengisoli]
MKKLVLFCLMVVFSSNFYAQETTAKTTKSKTEASAKKAKTTADKASADAKKEATKSKKAADDAKASFV